MKMKWLAVISLVVLVSILATTALADNPIKLFVNGQEIKPEVPPQIINDRTMVPVRWIAEAMGADVEWNKNSKSVLINSKAFPAGIAKEEVATLIQEQGGSGDYYIEALAYELVNLDADDNLEIVAKIEGGVHLGQFFIFKKDLHGEYQLITEQCWGKVERWDLGNPLEIDGKKLFEVVTRTGGTGIDIFNVHLVYLEENNFIEAWQGTLFERSAALPEEYYKKIGSYQVDRESSQLYAWETAHQLNEDGITPKGEVRTTTTIYFFDGKKFRHQPLF